LSNNVGTGMLVSFLISGYYTYTQTNNMVWSVFLAIISGFMYILIAIFIAILTPELPGE